MSALWDAAECRGATGGTTPGDWAARGVSIDSRSLVPGDLFIALRGPTHDGHGFVADALDRGAAAAVVDRDLPDLPQERLLHVGDTMTALQSLGRAGRARSAAHIAAVTGSVGKTGTKEALRHVLGRQARSHVSAGSQNNHWGVPLSLARLPQAAQYGVFELGMNHPGELGPLSHQVRPHVALITTVAAVHQEFFPDVAAIADAKSEIFQGLEPCGTALINADNAYADRMLAAAKACDAGAILTFGSDAKADARLLNAACDIAGSQIEAEVLGRRLRYRLGVAGEHWVVNSLAVLLTVAALGADVPDAAAQLASLNAPEGRGRRQDLIIGDIPITLIDDSYNASPPAVAAAMGLLGLAQPQGRRVAVLGDMLELGDHAPALHAGLAEPIAAAGIDLVFTCGPLMAHLAEALPAGRHGGHAADSEALIPLLRDALAPGDWVLVKGSAGSRMGRVVRALAEAATEPKREAADAV